MHQKKKLGFCICLYAFEKTTKDLHLKQKLHTIFQTIVEKIRTIFTSRNEFIEIFANLLKKSNHILHLAKKKIAHVIKSK